MNRKDPVFANFDWSSPYTQTLFNHKWRGKIKVRWADGVFQNDLESLSQDKTLLVTNCIFNGCESYTKNIHSANPSYYGLMYHDYRVDENADIQKKFNCFSNRFDLFRQSWFYHLVRRNWLTQGWISFNCERSDNRVPNKTYLNLTDQELFDKGFVESNSVFAVEHETSRHLVPFKNFTDTGDLTNLVMTSKFSIILETWFHANHCITFTEKTMRCLQLPRPWLLFSTQHAVKQLREWGFDVLDDIIDHSYDQLETPVQRQLSILEQAERLQDYNIPGMPQRCKTAAEHNKSLLKSWNKAWFINIYKDYEIAEQRAATL